MILALHSCEVAHCFTAKRDRARLRRGESAECFPHEGQDWGEMGVSGKVLVVTAVAAYALPVPTCPTLPAQVPREASGFVSSHPLIAEPVMGVRGALEVLGLPFWG